MSDTRMDPAQRTLWQKQNNLLYLGLIGIGTVLVQPFVTESDLDPSATVCVVAFAIAIPLLAVLSMLNQLEELHGTTLYSRAAGFAKGLGLLGAMTGVVAAFWHIHWLAGLGIVVSGLTAMVLYASLTRKVARQGMSEGTG
ncbi:hypothetical protein [Kribbella sp. CA-247076]|uniref:hypothetical protein n=1 Tax=Kribbella sp. CA-247076 TaxID=3239941 RepID=UPI003D8F53B2